MKKHYAVVLLLLSIVWYASGQNITVNNSGNYASPMWLAENVLVDPNFTIWSPIVNGMPVSQPNTVQVGFFNAVGTPLGLDSGIVMCTDNISVCVPGNPDLSQYTATTDPELVSVLNTIGSSNTNVYDKSEIQFSFVAISDSIEFRYVFASREYKSFTCSSFNDVFGFFLEGPGINGAPVTANSVVNLATIPNTTTPVAINTVNRGSGGNPANCLAANPNYVAHSVYYYENTAWSSNGSTNANSQVNMAGWTVPFKAKAKVVCGNTYTIRLKIADVSDGSYNSAVFLDAQSFKSPSIKINAELNSGNSIQDSQIVEGCAPSYLIFEKDLNVAYGMGINLAYSGNALPNIDYAQLPDSIWIAPGVAADTLFLEAFDDGIVELNDSLVVTMQPVTTQCYVYPPVQKVYYFRDRDSLQVQATTASGNDTIYCPGDTITLEGIATNGEGIITTGWLDDATAPPIRVVNPNQTSTYYFYATDECMLDTIVDSITIYLADYLPMEYNVDTVQVCLGDTAYFTLSVQNGSPPYVYLWPDSSTSTTYFAVPTDSTFYPFKITDACGVSVIDSMLGYVAPQPDARFNKYDDGGVPLRVHFSNSSLYGQDYFWNFGDGTTSTQENPTHDFPEPGEYEVKLHITSAEGCQDSITLLVSVKTDFYLYVPTAFTPDGDGLNECFEIKGSGFESFEIQIFDRWGNQVFHSEAIEDCWDGTYKGKLAQQGVYTYTIFLRLPFDKISQRTGKLTLYR